MGQEKIGAIDTSVVKAMGAFGGGIAASGDTCGILLGGVALISTMYSRGTVDEKEDPHMWSLSAEFTRQFHALAEPYGGTCCRDLARIDWQDRAAVKKFYNDPDSRRKICIELVGEAARVLGELLEADQQK